jgi:hypothetical protein
MPHARPSQPLRFTATICTGHTSSIGAATTTSRSPGRPFGRPRQPFRRAPGFVPTRGRPRAHIGSPRLKTPVMCPPPASSSTRRRRRRTASRSLTVRVPGSVRQPPRGCKPHRDRGRDLGATPPSTPTRRCESPRTSDRHCRLCATTRSARATASRRNPSAPVQAIVAPPQRVQGNSGPSARHGGRFVQCLPTGALGAADRRRAGRRESALGYGQPRLNRWGRRPSVNRRR